MVEVARYEREPDEVGWPRSAAERAVDRERRIMQAINAAKKQVAAQVAVLEAELCLLGQVVVEQTAAAIYAREDEITDPRVRHVVQTFDRRLLDLHVRHQEGFRRLAGEQFALQLSRDITPAKPPTPTPHTFWQQLALGALRG